jgi:Cys-rich protein (TIGR01571 family)
VTARSTAPGTGPTASSDAAATAETAAAEASSSPASPVRVQKGSGDQVKTKSENVKSKLAVRARICVFPALNSIFQSFKFNINSGLQISGNISSETEQINAFIAYLLSSGCCYMLLACLFPCLAVCLLRGKTRVRYNIQGGGCGDCCCACLCTPCANCQIANEIDAQNV